MIVQLDILRFLHHIAIKGVERPRKFNDDKDCEGFVEGFSIPLPETKTQCYAQVLKLSQLALCSSPQNSKG